MAGHRTGDASLAQSLTSLPSISDLGQTYRSHDPNSMSQDEDDGEARDHAHDLSAPASPSQALSRSLSVSSTSSAQHVDASPTKHSRHASAVTFGGTTTLSAGEYSDNESLRPPIFRRRTTSTALLGGSEPVALDYGTMSNGTRSKSAQGLPSLSGFASLRSPRAQKIRRTLEATAGYVGVRRALSYDEVRAPRPALFLPYSTDLSLECCYRDWESILLRLALYRTATVIGRPRTLPWIGFTTRSKACSPPNRPSHPL